LNRWVQPGIRKKEKRKGKPGRKEDQERAGSPHR